VIPCKYASFKIFQLMLPCNVFVHIGLIEIVRFVYYVKRIFIQTRIVEFMPLFLSLCYLIKNLVWVGYSLVSKVNIFIKVNKNPTWPSWKNLCPWTYQAPQDVMKNVLLFFLGQNNNYKFQFMSYLQWQANNITSHSTYIKRCRCKVSYDVVYIHTFLFWFNFVIFVLQDDIVKLYIHIVLESSAKWNC